MVLEVIIFHTSVRRRQNVAARLQTSLSSGPKQSFQREVIPKTNIHQKTTDG